MTILLKALIILLASAAMVTTAADEAPYLYVLGVAQDAGFPQVVTNRTACQGGTIPRQKLALHH